MSEATPVFELWRAGILTFEAAGTYDNPFLDVEIWAAFSAPSGRVIRREAYWDGGNVWRVSFAPTEPGAWAYTLEAPEKTGLDGRAGALEAVPYEGELAIYQHGFLKVSDNGRYFEHADGTPFFWLGDTHWEASWGERWDESNHPGMQSQFCGMVDKRVSQGYTVYQTNLRSDMGPGVNHFWMEGEHPGERGERDLPNVEFFQNELDRRMAYIADAGLVNALGQAWCFAINREGGIEHQKHLARYILARYGALPIVWTLAGETAGYDLTPEVHQRHVDRWREVALEIERRDGYGTLQTAHYTNERPFADYYQDESWFDFTLNQAGHGDYLITEQDYADFFAKHPGKPFVEGEAMYELCSTLEEMGTRLCTADLLRRVAYMSIQLGGAGFTYGAQGIWDNVWEKVKEMNPFFAIFNRFNVTWVEAVDAPGATQMGYMRRFYEDVRFWELAPVTASDGGNLFANKTPLATATADRARIVAYYGDTARRSLKIDGIDDAAIYRARWFDPREGTYAEGEEVRAQEGTLTLPAKPNLGDWLVVLEHV